METYQKSTINYLWYIDIERVEGGVKLLRHYRKHYSASVVADGQGHIVESKDGKRTAIEVDVARWGCPSTRLTVVNPLNVFAYGE